MDRNFEKRHSPAGVVTTVDAKRLTPKALEVIVSFNITGRSDAERYLRAVDEARMVGCDNLILPNSPLEASGHFVPRRTTLGRIV